MYQMKTLHIMKQTLIKTSLQTLLLLLSMCLILFLMRTEKTDIPIKAESHEIQSFVKASQTTPYSMSPLGFSENRGQIGPQDYIKFYFRNEGVGCYLGTGGISYIWSSHSSTDSMKGKLMQSQRLDLKWVGAQKDVLPQGLDAHSALMNFYTEEVPEGIVGIKSFRKVCYENLYPHIDLVLYFEDQHLKYDFIVKPGGKVSDIQLKYEGEYDLSLETDGSLSLSNALGTLREGVPFTYQVHEGKRIQVEAQYLVQDSLVSYRVGTYDPQANLIIDPELIWSTYIGNVSEESAKAVETDSKGNVYVAGYSHSYWNDLATQQELAEYWTGSEAFLAKFDPTGALLWGTFYGGAGYDEGTAASVDPENNIYLAGFTQSDEGIAENGHDESYNETNEVEVGGNYARDAFLVKFDGNGHRLWGTYYGGEDDKADEGRAVCTDDEGNVYLAGYTESESQIAFNGHDNSYAGGLDAFLVKFDENGTREWATYYGSTQKDVANAIAVDPAGEVYMAGYTESSNIASGGFDNVYAGNSDAFMVKFTPDGTRLWATYYGSNGIDQAHSLAVLGGFVFMAGVTSSPNNIAHNGEDMNLSGGMDAFLVKFNMFGGREWATYFGGPEDEAHERFHNWYLDDYQRTTSVCVSKNGDVYMAGPTQSNSGIAHNGYDNTLDGTWDGFLVRYLPDGSEQWATYFGGDESVITNNAGDYLYGVTTDVSAYVYVAGQTFSEDITLDGYDEDFIEEIDGMNFQNHGEALLAKFKPYGGGQHDGPGDVKDDERDPNDSPNGGKDKKDRKGILSSSAHNSFSLYPNPSLGVVNIKSLDPNEGTYQMEVFNPAGTRVFQQADLKGFLDQQIDLSHLPGGSYFVKVQGAQSSYTQKLILQ